ncbi:MAG: phage terminase small subunit P27 family [Actinomycetota bacterium]|nr:phage terminase small subunit P27 family [Actinomycetota bacterium]
MTVLRPLEGGREGAPQAPAGLLKATRDEWEAYWASPVSQAAEDVDVAALERLFTYRDEWRRATRAVRKAGRLTAGSKGQPRLNPLVDYVVRLEGMVRALETEVGLTPMSRARLGLTVGQAQLNLEELNRRLADQIGPAEEGEG